MFVMVSPLLAHMSETLTSLKFAKKVCFFSKMLLDVKANVSKVSQVNIGTAKKVKVDSVSP
jgi:hypothetical protein